MGQKISSPWASLLGFHATLPIRDLEPQNLQIGALPENQAILAEPSILRWFEYIFNKTLNLLIKFLSKFYPFFWLLVCYKRRLSFKVNLLNFMILDFDCNQWIGE